jgi:hypothetical protein
MCGIAISPVNSRRDRSGHCNHARTRIDAHDPTAITEAFPREPRDDTGAAGDVENPNVLTKSRTIEQFLRKRTEERPNQKAFV